MKKYELFEDMWKLVAVAVVLYAVNKIVYIISLYVYSIIKY